MTCETAVKVLGETDVLLATAWRVPAMCEALLAICPDLKVGALAGYTTAEVRLAFLATTTFGKAPDMARRNG